MSRHRAKLWGLSFTGANLRGGLGLGITGGAGGGGGRYLRVALRRQGWGGGLRGPFKRRDLSNGTEEPKCEARPRGQKRYTRKCLRRAGAAPPEASPLWAATRRRSEMATTAGRGSFSASTKRSGGECQGWSGSPWGRRPEPGPGRARAAYAHAEVPSGPALSAWPEAPPRHPPPLRNGSGRGRPPRLGNGIARPALLSFGLRPSWPRSCGVGGQRAGVGDPELRLRPPGLGRLHTRWTQLLLMNEE